nr:immunoglobulin heavy chain junction region [Mus musculus]
CARSLSNFLWYFDVW